MKKAYITLLILFSFLLASSQSIEYQPTPTAKYIFIISDLLTNSLELEQLDELLIGVGWMADNRKKWKEMMKSSYNILQDEISSKLKGLKILPLNTLEGKIKYSRLGFPVSSLKKAAASCDYSQLLQLNIVIGSHGLNRTFRVGEKDKKNISFTSLLPTVEISMIFYDSKGKKTATVKGTSYRKDTKRMKINTLNTNSKHISTETVINRPQMLEYYSFLDLAIEDLIDNFSVD